VTKPHTSRNQKAGLFTKADVAYDAAPDTYRCPAGATLTYRFTADEAGRRTRYSATPACGTCSIRACCTRSPKEGRRIRRWEHERLLDAMAERVRAHPALMKRRNEIVEHPFGTMKRSMNQGYFLLRGLPKGCAEMSLTAYKRKRVMTILGVSTLVAAVVAGSNAARTPLLVTAALRASALVVAWWLVHTIQAGVFTRSGAVLGRPSMTRTNKVA
jgi:hypothetical protein